MTCTHLQELYQLCRDQKIKLGGADLVRFVCEQCGEQEVCPSLLIEEYEASHPGDEAQQAEPSSQDDAS